jgi:hypothetical protein
VSDLFTINGAAHDVDPQETAWSYREANWSQILAGIDPDPAKRDIISSRAREYWEDVVHLSSLTNEGQA